MKKLPFTDLVGSWMRRGVPAYRVSDRVLRAVHYVTAVRGRRAVVVAGADQFGPLVMSIYALIGYSGVIPRREWLRADGRVFPCGMAYYVHGDAPSFYLLTIHAPTPDARVDRLIYEGVPNPGVRTRFLSCLQAGGTVEGDAWCEAPNPGEGDRGTDAGYYVRAKVFRRAEGGGNDGR